MLFDFKLNINYVYGMELLAILGIVLLLLYVLYQLRLIGPKKR